MRVTSPSITGPSTSMLSAISRSPAACMSTQPPPRGPPPLSPMLLVSDAGVLSLYSFSASIAGLFTSGEYLNDLASPFSVSYQDVVEISLAVDSALALGVGWGVASALTGVVCNQDWLGLDEENFRTAPLGLPGLLSNWLLFWPLAEALKALAAWGLATSWPATVTASGVGGGAGAAAAAAAAIGNVGVAGGGAELVHFIGASVGTAEPVSAALDVVARTALSDGSSSLIVLVLWRWWLLSWSQRFR
jgi:hypothetical protein